MRRCVVLFAIVMLLLPGVCGASPAVRQMVTQDWPGGWDVRGADMQAVDAAALHTMATRIVAAGSPRVLGSAGPVAAGGDTVQRMRNAGWTAFAEDFSAACAAARKGHADKAVVLQVAYTASFPTTLSYTLLGRERQMFLPAAPAEARSICVPLDPGADAPRWHATPELLRNDLRVESVSAVALDAAMHERAVAVALFLDRIFYPYAASFTLPGGMLPLGDSGVNSSFFQSSIDGEHSRVRPSLLIAAGTEVAKTVTLAGDGEVRMDVSAAPLGVLSPVTLELLAERGGRRTSLWRESFDPAQDVDGAPWSMRAVRVPLRVAPGERVRLVLRAEAEGGEPGLPAGVGIVSGMSVTGVVPAAGPGRAQDIVVVVPDSLRAQTAYDQRLLRSGRGLARLMAWPDTLTFTHAYSPSNTTTPSTNAVLHGRHLAEFPIFYYPAQPSNLFAYMRSHGYRTYCVTTNPYLIPRLEFYVDEYIYHFGIMHGEKLFKAAEEILARRDADGRPAFVFIQAMETHSPDAVGRVVSDCMDKPESLVQYMRHLDKKPFADMGTVTRVRQGQDMTLTNYKGASDAFEWNAQEAAVTVDGAQRLLMGTAPGGLVPFDDDVVLRSFDVRVEFGSAAMRGALSHVEVNLFREDGSSQMYAEARPIAEDGAEVTFRVNVSHMLRGGPDAVDVPLEAFTGPQVLQLHFDAPVSGRITVRSVARHTRSRQLVAFLDEAREMAAADPLPRGTPPTMKTGKQYPPEGLQHFRDGYRMKWMYFDAKFDAFLDALDARYGADGADGGVAMLYFADHGQSLGEHGVYGHGSSLYNQQIHVPLIVHVPGRFDGATRTVAGPVSTVSVYATLVDLVEGAGSELLRGASLLAAHGRAPQGVAFAQIDPREAPQRVAFMRADGKVVMDLGQGWTRLTANDAEERLLMAAPDLERAALWRAKWYRGLGSGAGAQAGRATTRLDVTLNQNLKALQDLGYVE